MIDLFDVTTCPTCSGSGTVLAHSFIAHTSRRSDPETSQQAGKRHEGDVRVLRPGTVKYAVLRTFVDGERTALEAALVAVGRTAPVSVVEGARRRVSDLMRAGYVTTTGTAANPGGSKATTYRITTAGLHALNRLREVS